MTGYVLGLDEALDKDVELHFLCNERLSSDPRNLVPWSLSLPALISADLSKMLPKDSSGNRYAVNDFNNTAKSWYKRSLVRDENREWLNHVLYPADTALHDLFCGKEEPSVHRVREVVGHVDEVRRTYM